MSSHYHRFLEQRAQFGEDSGFEPSWFPDKIFPFQQAMVEWACRKGRAALFEDVGLGKSIQELTWAENVIRRTNRPVLLLTPLAVGPQMVKEGKKFGIDAKRSKDGKHDGTARVVVANYQRLHLFDAADFGGVVLDESSILKNFDGATKKAVTEFMLKTPYRLLATATAAPNDFIELGTSSEALGYLGFADMLGKFFKKGEKTMSRSDEHRHGLYRFRGHAEKDFWRWVVSWARALRKPSDMGFPDTGYVLPPIQMRQHTVSANVKPEGFLFDMIAVGLKEQRDERKRTLTERCEMAAQLVTGHDCSILWCHLNPEGDLLEKLIPDCLQISGNDDDDEKEEKIEAFLLKQCKRLISKPNIIGHGLNLQHCAHQTWFPSHSFEQFYQGVGRCHRFGQKRNVIIDMVTSEGESEVLKNLTRKREQAERMFSHLVELMNDSLSVRVDRNHNNQTVIPSWLQ